MIDLFISAFVTLFVVIDPPGCAPIYASLTTGASAAQRRSMAIRATLIAGCILVFFAMFGEALLSFLHIDLDSFRIAKNTRISPAMTMARIAIDRRCCALAPVVRLA